MSTIPTPQEYLRGYLDGKSPPAANDRPVTYEDELDKRRQADLDYRIRLARPDEAAKANALAREVGAPAPLVRGNIPAFEAQRNALGVAAVAKDNPGFARWAADQRNAEIAADDYSSLSLLGKAMYGIANIGKSLAAGTNTAMAGLYGVAAAAFELEDSYSPVAWAERQLSGVSRAGTAARSARMFQSMGKRAADDFRPSVDDWTARNLLSGIESLPLTATAIASGLVAGPGASAAIMGGSVGGNEYVRARDVGRSPVTSAIYGLSQGAIEFATEKLPASALLGDIAKKSPIGKMLLHQILTEVPQEQVATVLQDLNEWAVLNPEKPFSDYLKARPMAAAETAVATIGGVGATVGITRAAQRTAEVVGKVAARGASADAAADASGEMDALMKAAAESKARARDPEAFKALIAEMAQDGDVQELFVPADVVNSYMQSDGYAGEFDSYRDAVEEGLATGGDVVIPIDHAVANLAGTPAWGVISGDARITAGGMSLREAVTFNEAMADVMAELSDQMEAEARTAKEAAAPREQLVQSLTAKLQDAGFTPYTARQQAELLAQAAATRAARSGIDLTGTEFDNLAVNQVLPENLAQAQKADRLDFVINAMKRKADVNAKPGVSLLEFIAAKGGVQDTGGDLQTMGAQDWHKGKAFRKRLLQDEGRTLDDLTLAAFEAGYFPGLTERPSINDMLDAISAELAGSPVFANFVSEQAAAHDAAQAQLVQAADELRSLLQEAGLDPATATAREIRQAVARYSEQAQGAGFDQSRQDGEGRQGTGENLIVQHNLSAANLIHADNMRGLAVPSIAISNVDHPLDGFGEITLIGSRDLVDPRKDRAARVFDADVYSPRYPTVRYKLAKAAHSKAFKRLGGASEELGHVLSGEIDISEVERKGLEVFRDSSAVQLQFLRDTDRGIDLPRKVARSNYLATVPELRDVLSGGRFHPSIYDDAAAMAAIEKAINLELDQIRDAAPDLDMDDMRGDYYTLSGKVRPSVIESMLDEIQIANDPGIDRYAARSAIRNAVAPHADEFASWVEAEFGDVIAGETIQTETASGDWRYLPHTLDNVVKVLRKKLRDGEGFNYGVGSIRSTVANQFKSVSAIQKERGRLIPSDAMQALKDEADQEFMALASSFEVYLPYEAGFGFLDTFSEHLKEVAERGERVLDQYYKALPDDRKQAAVAFLDKIATMPTEYFEAKLQRAVALSEFKAAVIPSDTPQAAKDALKFARVPVFEYDRKSPSSRAAVTRLAAGEGRLLFQSPQAGSDGGSQSFADGPRGRITFPATGYGTGRTIIDLFQSRDQSTFLHEAGHMWLEELRFDALAPNAPEQLKADWQTVQDWFAANGHPLEDGIIPVEAHEMWARGVERYLMEGKAPSPALRDLFQTLKSWLVQVYRTVDRLNTPITDDVRAVMDRIIATDEEIAQARQAQAIEAGFAEKPATMSEAEWQAYQALTTKARDTANDTLLGKVMAAIKRRVTKEYKEQAAAVREEVAAEIDRRPEFRALRQLRETPMDRAMIADIYGEDALAMLPKQVPPVYRTDGANPNDVAELSGFTSADEMVRTLMGVETRRQQLKEGGDKRSVREAMIAQEVDARMLERHGDPFTDGSIEEEALAAVHSDEQGEVMAAELRVLSRSTGSRPTPYSVAKAWAARTIRAGKVRDTTSRSAIQRYRRAAAKAGREFQDAIVARDNVAAFKAKQAQMLNNALLAEAERVAREVDSAVKRLSNWAKRKTVKSVDQDYLERAQALLEQVDMKPRTGRFLERQAGFEAWATEQEELGYTVIVPPSFAASLGTTHWSQLDVDQLLGLDMAVAQIIHLGRHKQKLLDGKAARDHEEVVAEALTQNAGSPRKPTVTGFIDPGFLDRAKQSVLSVDAAMLKGETIMDWMDRGDPNGVYNRLVFQPLAEAQEKRRVLMKDKLEKVEAARQKVPEKTRKRWKDKITLPFTDRYTGRPAVMTRDQLVVMALNMGNEGNAAKLAGGHGWNEAAILDYLNTTLTADEWHFVQEIWDIIDEFRPEAFALERRVNGIEPEAVEARAIETSAGTLRGGYYPVTYDPTRDLRVEKEHDLLGASVIEGWLKKPNTKSGALNERTEVTDRPILLTFGTINQHITEMAHDITHREALMNAHKFLNDPRIVQDVREVLGVEVQKQLNPWLDHIAKEWVASTAGMVGLERWINNLRTNATFVGLAYRASTGMMQVAGLFNSAEAIGMRHVVGGINSFRRHPIETTNFVLENSLEVRARVEAMDRDIRDAIHRETSKFGFISDVKRFGFYHIGMLDRFVSVTTWMGAYNKALASGMDDTQAMHAADKAVRQSQGSGAAKDLAAIQRGKGTAGAASKLLTMFYSYFSAFYQRQRTLARDYGKAFRSGAVEDFPALLARTMWLYFFPALASELLAGRAPDDDEDWTTWAIGNIAVSALGPIPLIRDIAGGIESGFGYTFTPASGAGRTAVNVWKNAARIIQGEETKRATRDVMELAGYFGAPVAGQVAASTQFLVDVAMGEQDPEDFADWYQGLTKGKIKE